MIKEADVWKAARKYGGVAVQYGTSEVYEIIMQGDSKNKCCVVISDSPIADMTTKRIAKSISDRCFIVRTASALERVISNTAKGFC